MYSSIFGVALGALIALLMTVFLEILRKPELKIRLARPSDQPYHSGPPRPAKDARFLGLELINCPLSGWAKWVSRSAALQCHGTITFHHLDGQNVFGRSMPIRWSSTPGPQTGEIILGDQKGTIYDTALFSLSQRVDVYPCEYERLDVAAKFDDDDESYGWCNESYFSVPQWRNPNWRLARGRYLVHVVVMSSGEKCEGLFRLIADVARNDFRLELPLKNDRIDDSLANSQRKFDRVLAKVRDVEPDEQDRL